MDMNTLLEALYETDPSSASLEKTAEAALLAGLQPEQASAENPFLNLPTEDLIKLASELDAPVAEEAVIEEDAVDPELEKVAFDMLGGQIMAHAMVHEFGLMKVAMSQGVCRVCKEQSMNIEGSTICSVCLESE
tara:strand:- start:49 stop:450 length:402 start_codon:yes stop_codon:yes gene_type:complete